MPTLFYPSDFTDVEWEKIQPLLPLEKPLLNAELVAQVRTQAGRAPLN